MQPEDELRRLGDALERAVQRSLARRARMGAGARGLAVAGVALAVLAGVRSQPGTDPPGRVAASPPPAGTTTAHRPVSTAAEGVQVIAATAWSRPRWAAMTGESQSHGVRRGFTSPQRRAQSPQAGAAPRRPTMKPTR